MEWSFGRLSVHTNEWGEFVFVVNDHDGREALGEFQAMALADEILNTIKRWNESE